MDFYTFFFFKPVLFLYMDALSACVPLQCVSLVPVIIVTVSIAVKRRHDYSNSYKENI